MEIMCGLFVALLLQAGLGGGTGRGAGPVVADIARQQGAFTVAVALVPEQQHGSPHVDVVSALKRLPGVNTGHGCLPTWQCQGLYIWCGELQWVG